MSSTRHGRTPSRARERTASDDGAPVEHAAVASIGRVTAFPQTHADLLDAPFATLGTIDSEGRPQLTEVWFLHDDGELKLWLNDRRAKTRNLRERPVCSVLILDLQNPRRYLEVRGRARLTPDPDRAFAPKLGAKYGMDLTRIDPPGQARFIVIVEPEKIYAVDMSR